MRLCLVADIHGYLPRVAPCDVLLVAGDLCPVADHSVGVQAEWLGTAFRAWLDAVPAAHVVGIAGNHDVVFQRAPELVPRDLRWTYLQDDACTVDGLTVWGSPWTPWFSEWAFSAPRDDGEAFLAQRYANAPLDVDVLLLHGPPRGYGDRTLSGQQVGSTSALELVERLAPPLCAFGHIHECRGAWTLGPTSLRNVAAVDERYALRADPVAVVELTPG